MKDLLCVLLDLLILGLFMVIVLPAFLFAVALRHAAAVLMLVALAAAPLALAQDLSPLAGARLVTTPKHDRLTRLLPRVDDARIAALLADPRLIVYTDLEMPSAFQAANRGQLGVFAGGRTFQVAGVTVGRGSSTRPWRAPAGFDDAVGWSSFRFLLLPSGGVIEWGFERQPGDTQAAAPITWTYPEGTVLGEVFQVEPRADSLSRDPVTFELRIREKVAAGTWRPDVFRPFRTREELNLAVALSGSPRADAFVAGAQRERWDFPQRAGMRANVLPSAAIKDILPPLDEPTVRHLLAGEFASARDHEWVSGGFAPDTRAGFHVVPSGYNAAALPVSRASCASCHATAGVNVNRFGIASPPGWDEWVRGSAADQSFSLHIFDPASVSTSETFRPIRLNPKLVAAGFLKQRGTR